VHEVALDLNGNVYIKSKFRELEKEYQIPPMFMKVLTPNDIADRLEKKFIELGK
jgi:hypothetical protein